MRWLAAATAFWLALYPGGALGRMPTPHRRAAAAHWVRLRRVEARLVRQVALLSRPTATDIDRAAARATVLECGRLIQNVTRARGGPDALVPVLREVLRRESRWQRSALAAGRFAEVRAEARAISETLRDAARAWP